MSEVSNSNLFIVVIVFKIFLSDGDKIRTNQRGLGDIPTSIYYRSITRWLWSGHNVVYWRDLRYTVSKVYFPSCKQLSRLSIFHTFHLWLTGKTSINRDARKRDNNRLLLFLIRPCKQSIRNMNCLRTRCQQVWNVLRTEEREVCRVLRLVELRRMLRVACVYRRGDRKDEK